LKNGAPSRCLLLFAMALGAACGDGGIANADPQMKVLCSFSNVRGANPAGALIADGAGGLYGTTFKGGATGNGVVFELAPAAAKTAWTETVLFSFNGANGDQPFARLLADGAGDLYGTTSKGGSDNDGVVFELASPTAGKTAWAETVLLSFNGANGSLPSTGLTADGEGDLFGTTLGGGANGLGVVFELIPPLVGGRAWTQRILVSFTGANGLFPAGDLITDRAGNLYGTTEGGGANNNGLVFELSPPLAGGSAWTETVLFSFDKDDGEFPVGGLITDRAGNLYGVTQGGGANSDGVVFELSPAGPGKTAWTETVLHSFNAINAGNPSGALTADGAGNLYGTTRLGGVNDGGVVFELTPPKSGKAAWTETVVQSFSGPNGHGPQAGVIADGAGNLYGTTWTGGSDNDGVAFELMKEGTRASFRSPR
jgi:uncharacterized repeat protein (TIGR03803 family)